MSRERNPIRDIAKQKWLNSKGSTLLKDIAAELNIPENRVRKWKSMDKWEQELKGNAPIDAPIEMKVNVPKHGAPKGCRNACGNSGGGAPKNNKNNHRHGIYEKLLFETMSEDEKELMLDLDVDEKTELLRMLRFCDMEIIRLNRLIKEAQEKPGGLMIKNVTKTESKLADNVISKSTVTNTVSTIDMILRYKAEIQKIIRQKIRCLESLIKLGYNTQKLELELIKAEETNQTGNTGEVQNTDLLDALEESTKGAWDNE